MISRFPSKFLKCSFHFCTISSWQAALSFAVEVLFLSLNSFTFYSAYHYWLSSTEFLIFWFGLECILVVLFVMFYLVRSDLSYIYGHWRLLNFFHWVRIHFYIILFLLNSYCLPWNSDSHSASMWAVTKCSYSSFEICLSDVSWSVSIAYITIDKWRQVISKILPVCFIILQRLGRIFTEMILWSGDNPSNKEYALQFKVLFIHFLFINI